MTSPMVDDSSDPDFIGPLPPKTPNKKSDDIALNFNNKVWIRALNLQTRQGQSSNALVFRIMAASGDLEKFNLSEEGLGLARIAHDKEIADGIKENFVWPKFLEIHFDG